MATRIYVDDTTGNVGIGTTAPSARLDVVGTSEFNGDLRVDGVSLFVQASSNRVGNTGSVRRNEACTVVDTACDTDIAI